MSFLENWFERRLDALVKGAQRKPDLDFDALVDGVGRLATFYDRLFGWLPDRDRSPVSVSLGGSADAVGQNTVARTHLEASLVDYGAVSVGFGRARFEARAEAGPENPDALAFAEASSQVEGADFVVTLDRTVTGPNWEVASHAYFAVDLAAIELHDPIELSYEIERQSRRVRDVADGNVADAEVDAEARSDDTLVDLDLDLLAIEDTLSGSSVEAVLAIA